VSQKQEENIASHSMVIILVFVIVEQIFMVCLKVKHPQSRQEHSLIHQR